MSHYAVCFEEPATAYQAILYVPVRDKPRRSTPPSLQIRRIQLLRDEGTDTTNASVGMQAGGLLVSARMACGSNRVGGRKQEPAETTMHGAIYA